MLSGKYGCPTTNIGQRKPCKSPYETLQSMADMKGYWPTVDGVKWFLNYIKKTLHMIK